jgi:hypothetical protein
VRKIPSIAATYRDMPFPKYAANSSISDTVMDPLSQIHGSTAARTRHGPENDISAIFRAMSLVQGKFDAL